MRVYLLLLDLVNAHDYLTVDYFVEKYGVSKRTIQNDLSYLMKISQSKGYELKQFRGKGYLLEITDAEKFDEFENSLNIDEVVESKDRITNILAYIAIQEKYISMDEIADYFQISRTLLKKEIQEVERAAKNYDLVLRKKSHYGVTLEKTMIPFIKMLSNLYILENKIISNDFKRVLGDFEVIYKTLIDEFAKFELKINYAELKEVYVLLQVCTYIACRKQSKSFDYSMLEDDVFAELVIDLNEWVYKVYGTYIDKDALLVINKLIRRNSRSQNKDNKDLHRLETDINDFLKGIDPIYNTRFLEDEQFKKLLLNHVTLLIDRFYQKISYKNALLDEISIRYSRIFNIAILFSNMLKEKYGVTVSHDETAFIATHFASHFEKEKQMKIHRFNRIAVVCSSGGGSAYMIKMQIESIFSKEEVQSFSFIEMNQLHEFNPDIIFTIMPLSEDFKVPIIYIHELLDEDDLKKIKELLEYDHVDKMSLVNIPSKVNSLFSNKFFEIGEAHSYQDLLNKMASHIVEEGYGDEQFVENIFEREKYMSTVYLNGVAIPHPIEICSKKNVISTFIIKNPIQENGKDVKIVFMVSLTKEDCLRHQDITKLLYELMKDEHRLQQLLSVKSFEQMMVILREMEDIVR